ncbi:hypothetical protein GO495_07245 [Chitinophaga oryziterrae]|uniref:Uncharacterized protein n=1 Tax=Chitinophaga oryziterrae TaxID=1031224 RepID=A0A6N8J8C5_9BACT|nr:hypothetical protein [Chitinophaga oryziterrae]MVT40372.1 hypothetical protein [Chitinophaga oryziterrae]
MYKAEYYMPKVIDEEMHDYFMQLNDAEEKSVVLMLKTFIKSRQAAIENINILEYNNELADAEAEFEKGNYITHEQLLKTILSFL